MRFLALLVPLMLLGCITLGERMTNETNQTYPANESNPAVNGTTNETINQTNQTAPPPAHSRFSASGFGFDYPINMDVDSEEASAGGVFTGVHSIDGRTAETLAVVYVNVTKAYGMNREAILLSDPTKAASDFLIQDRESDSMGFFMKASYLGNITTFGIRRDVYAAQMPFTLMLNSGTVFSGYAMSLYIPERSTLLNVRIIALDPAKAKQIRDDLLLSLRLE